MERARRSPCPVACTLDLIGDRWTLLVIRDLMRGLTTFKQLMSSPEGIASNILSERLKRLVDQGLVERRPSASGRETYQLTRRGRSLHSVLEAVASWGLENVEGTEALLDPRRSTVTE